MHLTRPIPAPTLYAITTLLRPHLPDISETALVAAITSYNDAPAPASAVKPLLSKAAAAHLLAISTFTVQRLINTGKLSACRVGGQWRIRQEAVEAMRETEVFFHA
ncbi:MAG: hypothetical protein A3K18_30435 [Lentisphaerae bacterium RIFOXYA12_64_32]|nr:MAG: hypothetical protein A3K18_30435 [Lentisphaerae bacterium RIFOXYA12_64_32]